MARAWIKLIWNSVGVAAIAVAAQLGVAQALGIIRWSATFDAGDVGWKALLTWLAFIYASAVLGGAAVGRSAVRRPGKPEGVGARVVAASCAAVGAAAAVSLAWIPSRNMPIHVYPGLVVVTASGAGIVIGLVIAVAALSSPPVAGSVRAAVAWVWLVAIGSAAAGLATHKPYVSPRLAVIDAPSIVATAWWSGPSLMIGIAAVLGLVISALARWGGAHRIGVGVSGLTGPAMVAAAYLIAGRDGVGAAQVEPFNAALIAAGAGLCASVLVAAIPSKTTPGGPTPHSPSLDSPSLDSPTSTNATSDGATAGHEKTSRNKTSPDKTSRDKASRDKASRGKAGRRGKHDSNSKRSGQAAIPSQPDRALVGEIVDGRAAVTGQALAGQAVAGQTVAGQAAASPSNRVSEEDYASWIRDLGDRQRA